MTDRAEIERLLNQTGRTLEGLPHSYSVQEVDNRFERIIGDWRFDDFVLHQSDVIELLVGALRDALDKRTKWISVEERLPEQNGIYLAHVVHRYCKIDSYWRVCIEYFGIEGTWDSLADIYEVTHWMPLPKPPKEERE